MTKRTVIEFCPIRRKHSHDFGCFPVQWSAWNTVPSRAPVSARHKAAARCGSVRQHHSAKLERWWTPDDENGSTTGRAVMLQNGVMSNAIPFAVNTLQVTDIADRVRENPEQWLPSSATASELHRETRSSRAREHQRRSYWLTTPSRRRGGIPMR